MEIPWRESKLRPSTSPTMPSGRGPATPVGIRVTSISGVNIVVVVELKSSPALPGVALRSSEMEQRGKSDSTRLLLLLSGAGAAPAACFPETGKNYFLVLGG